MKNLMKSKKFITLLMGFLLMSVLLISIYQIEPASAATITLVQGPARGVFFNQGSGTTFAVGLASAPASGDALIAVVGVNDADGNVVSKITQTGVTWTKQVSSANAPLDIEIWAGVVGTGAATTVVITLTDAGHDSDAHVSYATSDICEYSGLATSGVFLDKTATNSGLGITTSNTGTTATTTQGNELWIGGIADTLTNAIQTAPQNGFQLFDGEEGSGGTVAYLYNIVSGTGNAVSGTSANAINNWVGAMATFTTAAVAASPTPSPTATPTASPTATPTPPPTIPEFPGQLLAVMLVVSMIVVLSAVIVANKRRTLKTQRG